MGGQEEETCHDQSWLVLLKWGLCPEQYGLSHLGGAQSFWGAVLCAQKVRVTCGALPWLPKRLLSPVAQSQVHGTDQETALAPRGSARKDPSHTSCCGQSSPLVGG